MGNSASDIVKRVEALSKDNLSKSLQVDSKLLENPAVIFNTSEILCRNDLDIYAVPGSESLGLKNDDVGTNEEESMICSLINSARLREKHEDTTKALLDDILRKRGDDPNSKEMILRMQGCCRIFEALLRMDERAKKEKAEVESEKPKKAATMAPLARATMKFGFSTLMRIVNMMGTKNPEVYKFMISHTSEVLAEMAPLSLRTDDLSVNATIEKVVLFFEKILNGDLGNLSYEEKQSSISSLFALALASGNLLSTLALVTHFLKLKNSSNFASTLSHLTPHLKGFADLYIYNECLNWSKSRPYPNLQMTSDLLSISTTSSSFSTVLSEQIFTSGIHYFEFLVETRSDEMYLGVADASYSAFENWCDSRVDSWSFKSNGNINNKDNTRMSSSEIWQIGDHIGILLNMDKKTISFYRNGKKHPYESSNVISFSFENAKITASLYNCSKITILTEPEVPQDVFSILNEVKAYSDNSRMGQLLEKNESLANTLPSEIAAFVLRRLANLNTTVLDDLVKGKKISKKKIGISLDVQLKTIEILDSIVLQSIEIAKTGDYTDCTQEDCISILKNSLELLQAHLLATTYVKECDLSLEFRRQIISHATDVLNFLPNTEASKQATLTLSSCFSVFYDEPQEKLSYLIDRMEDMKNGKKQHGIFKELEDKIFMEMASPDVLFPALELINDEYHTVIEKYLALLCERAAKISMQIIDGKDSGIGIIKLLESSQIVLISQAAKANYQGKWQDILVSYSMKVCQLCDDILKHIAEKNKNGLLSDEFIERICKTMAKNALEGLLYALMLSKLSLDFLSKILPLLQNIIASLAYFVTPAPKLTQGVGIVSEIYESSHNYDNSMDVNHTVKIPQAKKYTLIFDPQFKTENGCDYLELYTDDTRANKLGRWEGETFPREPFEVDAPMLYFTFHSDGSVNYWGWKIEIKAVVEASYYKKIWPDTAKEATGLLLGLISAKLIAGDFELTQEDEEAAKLLSNPLLMYGIKDRSLVVAKEPGKINENLMVLSTTPGIGEKLKKAMLTRSYSEDVSRRVIRSQQVAKTLDDYVSDYGFWEEPIYSDIPFLQEFIEGRDWIIEAWNDIKKRSGVTGPASNIGGAEMDQAERAIFAVYTAFFEMTDTVSKLFHAPSDIGATLKHIVKQTNLIRGWAQKHKQKIMDEGNPDITYTKICVDIVKKCTVLLGSEYKLSLNELGVSKVMKHLLSTVVKAQQQDPAKAKEGSKWKTIKEAVGTASTLKNLLHISAKSSSNESDDMKEFAKVQELVNSFLESPCLVEQLVDLLDQRRTRAIARTLGYLCLANLINISPRQETMLIRAFGDALRSKGVKKHYWHGLEGADPVLMSIVQKSFYQTFGLLQKELIRSRQRPLTMYAYSHYLSVLEAMSSPLKGVDAHMILELQLTSTVNILLSWAKGHVGEEVINRAFQINKCITRVGVLDAQSVQQGSTKVLINTLEDGTEMCLVFDKGGENVQPITELIVSDSVLDDYEDAVGPVIIMGETRYIMIRREDPRNDSKYLTEVVDLNSPVFTPWEDIAASEPAEEKIQRQKLKERLSKCAWSLFKLLMYSIVGSIVEDNESKKILVQELFIRVLFVELRWDDSLHQPDTEAFMINKLSSGSPWLGQMLVPKGYQKNPMVEWLRQFKQELEHVDDFVIKDVINEFVEKADPAMKGVLTHNDLAYVDESITATLESFDENKNYKGEFDFIRYLRVLRSLAGDFPLDVQEYIENSKLWQTLPEDFYTASRDYDMSNISRIQEIIASRINKIGEDSFTKFLDKFLQSETPGIVDKSQLDESVPNEFKNSSQNMDLYVALHAIIRNQAKFEIYYNELQEVFRIYDDLPVSCEEILKERKGQSNYIGSLLWTLYGCFGSHCIPSVLAREEYLEELLKLTFLSSSENTVLPGARILAKVLPSQHSPQSFLKIWDNLSKYMPASEKKLDFITLLFNKLGKASYWYEQKESQKLLNRWGYEVESLLLALMEVDRWKTPILANIVDNLSKASAKLSLGMPIDLHHIGVLYFLANSSKNNDQLGAIPIELSRIKLKSSSFAYGTIKSIDGTNVNVYSVVEDSLITEAESNIEAIEPYVSTNFYSVLSLDEKKHLGEAIIKFWRALQGAYTKPLKGKPDSLATLRTLYSKLDMHALTCINDLFEKKDMANEAEIEEVLRLIIKKRKVCKPATKEIYATLMTEIGKKLKKSTRTEEEAKEMTEEEAMAKLAQMKEEDQILASELLSLDIPVLKIVKSFEAGIKELDKILSYQEPVKEEKSSTLLFSLISMNFEAKDTVGSAEIYQNKQGHFVISNSNHSSLRKEIIGSVNNSVFHDLESFSSGITILAALEGTSYEDQLNFGLKIGNLELAISTAPGFPCLMINGDISGEVSLSNTVELKINAKSTGDLVVSYGASHYEIFDNSVFNGLKIGKFGLFLDDGERASLLGFEIHDGKHEGTFKNKYNKAAAQSGGESCVQVKCKKQNNDRLRLRMLGYSDEQITEALSQSNDLTGALNYLFSQCSHTSMHGEQLSLVYESIIQLGLYDTLADVPKGFTVVPFYEEGNLVEYNIPNHRILAVKKEKLTEGNVCTDFNIGEAAAMKDGQNLGDLTLSTINDRSLSVWYKINAISKKEAPLKDIALIKTSKIFSVEVPRGFNLICDKEGKAINVAPRSEKGYYIFVAVRYQQSLYDCFITPFSSVGATASSFGIVDQFEAVEKKPSGKDDEIKYDQLSLMEIFNILWDAEEHRIQMSSKKLLLSLLKVSQDNLLSLSEKEGFGKIVDFLGDDLNMLDNSFNVLLENPSLVSFRENIIKEALSKLITYCIQPSDAIGGMLSPQTIESNHPYEDNLNVDDVITIKGARGLRIEFDPQCYTENGCDQLKFYERPNREGELACYTGQGESVWKPLEVPGDTVYTYFHTDGSVHYWGYKFTVIPVGSGSTEVSVKPDSALWLLEKIAKLEDMNNGLEAALTPRTIQPLLLFSLAADATNEKAKAIDIIRKLLRGQQYPVFNTFLKLLLQEATTLYVANKVTKSSHPLLQSLILLLAQNKDRYQIDISEPWFVDFSELLSDMKGLADKDAALEDFLFENFRVKASALEKVSESSHPYERVTSKTRVEIPGASSLTLEFDPQSKLDPKDDIYLSYDEEGLQSAQAATLPRTLAEAKWGSSVKGPDIEFSNNNMTVTRTNSSGWGNAIWNESYTEKVTTIKFYIDSVGDSQYLYLGVYKSGEQYQLNSFIGTDCPTPVWSWKISGQFCKQGSSSEGQGYTQGDIVAMQIDMNSKVLTFFKNDIEIYKFDGLPESVIPVISFGGSNQIVTIRSVEQTSILNSASISDRKLEVNGSSVWLWFPVNKGYSNKYSWESSVTTSIRSPDELTLTKTSEGTSIHSTATKVANGKHYTEVKISSEGEIGLGFFHQNALETSTVLDPRQIVYYSTGCYNLGEEKHEVEGFGVGDVIGNLLDIEAKQVSFFKNGNLIFTQENQNVTVGDNYRFTAVLSQPNQSLTISREPKLPSDVDLLNVSATSDKPEWGYKIKVIPSFRGRNPKIAESILSFVSEEIKKDWTENYRPKFVQFFKTGAAEQLVIYLDEMTATKGLEVLQLTPENIDPLPDELIYYPELERLTKEDIRELYKVLVNFNSRIENLLYLFNLHIESHSNMSELQRVFMGSRNFIFFKLKNGLLKESLTKTACESRTEITVDRPKAMRHKHRKDVDTNGQLSIYGQVFRAMLTKGNREYRNSERFFRVTYRGEAATDAGGPYNETISNMCDELMSSFLRLLIPIPNNVNNMGENRDCWIVNPSAESKTDMDLFLFLGKLMGCAIRTQNNLNISLSPLFWKRLLLDPVDVRDLRATDVCIVQILEILRNLDANGITRENFSFAYDIKFTTKDTSGRDVELIEGGADKPVTFDDAREYAELVEKFRLNENAKAYEMIRKGISAVVPLDYLNLFSWRQVQTLVCGAPTIDIDILKANTDYESGSATDPHILLFWEVVSEMSQKERSLLIKFIWGRSRLPSGRDWRHMKISRYNPPGPVNNYLPVSHTCFFTIDLPCYTTREAMKNKLLYAITHCSAIDLDGSAGAGWEDND